MPVDPAILVIFISSHSRRRVRVEAILKLVAFSAIFALSGSVAASAETAVLRNGFILNFDHHEVRGNVTRLYTDIGSENFVDVPINEVVSYEEQITETPPPSALKPVRASSLEDIVAAASVRYGIGADVLYSMIRAESAFDSTAVSRKGALGLMQLMPQTAARLGVKNPLDAASNVDGGTRYLLNLLSRYNYDLTKALAAYNAGPARVLQFHGVPPYPETIAYINRVEADLIQRKVAKSGSGLELVRKMDTNSSPKP